MVGMMVQVNNVQDRLPDVEYEFGRSNDKEMNSVLWVLQRCFIHNMR